LANKLGSDWTSNSFGTQLIESGTKLLEFQGQHFRMTAATRDINDFG
jgi:hypothetical protein